MTAPATSISAPDKVERPLQLYDLFDQAWQAAPYPDLEPFLDLGRRSGFEERGVLEELIVIDLEKRWKAQNTLADSKPDEFPQRPLLEDYVRRFPHLLDAASLSLDLIAEEYRVCRRSGDHPTRESYSRRFPERSQELLSRLAGIDEELAADWAGPQAMLSTRSQTRTGDATPHGQFARSHLPNIPGYEILEVLGEGGMGVVYKARHIQLKRLIALKMILAGGNAGEKMRARFRVEAESIARLQHPNIVQIFEVGDNQGLPYLSLEFCAGGSLDKRLAGTPLPPRSAAELVEKLAMAVQAAHLKGIVHRDLKPANVLVAEDGTPKITDFGLAKKLDESGSSLSGDVMGSPSYMAPEQARGSIHEIGARSDVYALGAILYECLSGRPPFKAASIMDTLNQVIHQEPVGLLQLNSNVPRDLDTICMKCLQKDPDKRFASAQELAEDLHRFLVGEPIKSRPIGWMVMMRRALAYNRLDVGFHQHWHSFCFLLASIIFVACCLEVASRQLNWPPWCLVLISRTSISLTMGLVILQWFRVTLALERHFLLIMYGNYVFIRVVYWVVYGTPLPPVGTHTLPLALVLNAIGFFFGGMTLTGVFYLFSVAFVIIGIVMSYLPYDIAQLLYGLTWGLAAGSVGFYFWRLQRKEAEKV